MESVIQPASDAAMPTSTCGRLDRLSMHYEYARADALLAQRDVLAVIGFGNNAPMIDDPRYLRVGLEPVINPAPFEVWRALGPVRSHRANGLAWAADADYAFGSLELAEAQHGGLAAATQHAYELIKSWRAASATSNLLRIWNYLDAINQGAGDDERYRQFCSGRAAGMGTDFAETYPAATAIGVRDGRRVVQIYWLAAREPGISVENPRQISAWRYPRRYGPTAPGFARGMRAPTQAPQLFISGTAAVVGHASHHDDDIGAQLDETLTNLASLKAAAQLDSVPQTHAQSLWKVYLRREDVAVVQPLLEARLGDALSILMLRGDICRAELLVEIDGMQNG